MRARVFFFNVTQFSLQGFERREPHITNACLEEGKGHACVLTASSRSPPDRSHAIYAVSLEKPMEICKGTKKRCSDEKKKKHHHLSSNHEMMMSTFHISMMLHGSRRLGACV
jgi:hypothetical protein